MGVDGINGANVPQNVKKANGSGATPQKGGGILDKIGQLLVNKHNTDSIDTPIKGWSIERQGGGVADYHGSIGYQGTAAYSVSVPVNVTTETIGNGGVENSGTVTQEISLSGVTEYEASIGYQGTVEYGGSVGDEGSVGYQGTAAYTGTIEGTGRQYTGTVGYEGSAAYTKRPGV